MKAHNEQIALMHKYLDGDLTKEEETKLRIHLEDCEACQAHFHELKRTITLIQSTEQITAPPHFTEIVMKRLPVEKKQIKLKRWIKGHPFLVAAAIFFMFMLGGAFSAWDQDQQLVVSKTENLVIEGDTVIVPEDVVVDGDLLVKNGNLIIKGRIDGNVTIINGELMEEDQGLDEKGLMASAGQVNGELETIDQVFEWLWYKMKTFFQQIFSF